jgi:pyruvate formate lyase activating enzyme
MTGVIARILPFSAVDGPGNRAVVFLQGCDFDCAYCHNPETRPVLSGARDETAAGEPRAPEGPPALGSGGFEGKWPRRMSVAETLSAIERYATFLRGLTISGGECLLQGDFLAALLEAARERGLPGLVDTNGSTPLEKLPRVLVAAAGFMLDVKAWNPEEHRALVGADNAAVLANLRLLARTGALSEVRTVVSPGAFDIEETVRETAAVLGAYGSSARYRLIRYRPYGVRTEQVARLSEPDDRLMARLAKLAIGAGAADVFVS